MTWQLPIGANVEDGGVRFRVWSPQAQRVEVVLFQDGREVATQALRRDEEAFFVGLVDGAGDGTQYQYRLDGEKTRPDPASRFQPQGVHGVSQVIDHNTFQWTDEQWNGVAADKVVIYEMHVGTATPAGTFEALISKLDYMKELGVTVLELLPVADFPGERGWGYDGVYLYAPARCYGQPDDLRRLIDAAHARGLAVFQDVVYNHLGPDGNYLRDYSLDYFTDKYKTPWGDALNYSCKAVREFFISNALFWAHEFHIDGLRLDATDTIFDEELPHILGEISQRVRATLAADRQFLLYAEDSRNLAIMIDTVENKGYGLDGIWADDFHHTMRVAVNHDTHGYYEDYTGSTAEIAATLNQGWTYQGEMSKFAGKPRGGPAGNATPTHYVHCIQNHDQIGNRALGDRLDHNVGEVAYRAVSTLLLTTPYTPLMFMGQEWAASTPWQFFTDHHDELGRLVTEGRRNEFPHVSMFEPELVPDPQDIETFERSKLNWAERNHSPYLHVFKLYQDLLKFRATTLTSRQRQRDSFKAIALSSQLLGLRYYQSDGQGDELLLVVCFGEDSQSYSLNERPETAPGNKQWQTVLFSEDVQYGGQGNAAFNYNVQEGVLTFNGPGAVLLKI